MHDGASPEFITKHKDSSSTLPTEPRLLAILDLAFSGDCQPHLTRKGRYWSEARVKLALR